MSFLADADDTMSTLDEVVAFIDSWDTQSTSQGDATTSESENDTSPFSHEDMESVLVDSLDGILEMASFIPKQKPEPEKSLKKKRKKVPGASTRLQRRKKAEIKSLKAQSQELERRLQQLKTRVLGFPCQQGWTTMPASSWFSVAGAQFHERVKSETTNQKLRSVLTEQTKLIEALRHAFQIQTSLGDLDAFLGKMPCPAPTTPLAGTDASLKVINELENMVEGLYRDSAGVFQPRGVPCISNALRIKQVNLGGRVLEINATYTMPCSIQEAGAMFWRDFLVIRQSKDKSYRFLRQRNPSSVEKNFHWLLPSAAGVTKINGFAFVRKIEEPNRAVLVEADRLLLSTQGSPFRIQRWTVISRLEETPQPSSVVRTLLQLHAEGTEGFKAGTQDILDAEDMVLGTLGQKLRTYLQRQQGEFIREAERIRTTTTAAGS